MLDSPSCIGMTAPTGSGSKREFGGDECRVGSGICEGDRLSILAGRASTFVAKVLAILSGEGMIVRKGSRKLRGTDTVPPDLRANDSAILAREFAVKSIDSTWSGDG